MVWRVYIELNPSSKVCVVLFVALLKHSWFLGFVFEKQHIYIFLDSTFTAKLRLLRHSSCFPEELCCLGLVKELLCQADDMFLNKKELYESIKLWIPEDSYFFWNQLLFWRGVYLGGERVKKKPIFLPAKSTNTPKHLHLKFYRLGKDQVFHLEGQSKHILSLHLQSNTNFLFMYRTWRIEICFLQVYRFYVSWKKRSFSTSKIFPIWIEKRFCAMKNIGIYNF